MYERGAEGMLSIAGGKFTTFRRIALDALERIRGDLGLRALERAPVPLPGAADPDAVVARLLRDHPALALASARHLARFHGSDALELLEPAREDAALLESLAPGAPEVAAEVRWAREREWALTADDVLARRTTLASLGRARETPAPACRSCCDDCALRRRARSGHDQQPLPPVRQGRERRRGRPAGAPPDHAAPGVGRA